MKLSENKFGGLSILKRLIRIEARRSVLKEELYLWQTHTQTEWQMIVVVITVTIS